VLSFARTARGGLARIAAPVTPAYLGRVTEARTTTRRASRQGRPASSRSEGGSSSTAASRLYGWLIPAVLVVATILAFLPVLGNGFVDWDDDKNFINNPHFRGLGADQLH